MNKNACFLPTDILIPADCDMTDWSVVACDQFSSEREYWDRVFARTQGKKSTAHMIIPEAYLGDADAPTPQECNAVMREYLAGDTFKTAAESFVYVERQTSDGLRRGLVGVIDLDKYEYTPGTSAPIRASEKTVVERLPPRIAVRRAAPIELPHVMVLIDDAACSVIEPLADKKDRLEKVYDFELMENGGRIAGWRVAGEDAEAVLNAFGAMSDRPVQIVIGDGNHSLAAAKACWDEIKTGLTEEQRENHPARFALAEANNVYDAGIVFEPIHRVVFGTNPEELLAALEEKQAGGEFELEVSYGGKSTKVSVSGASLGGMIKNLQDFLEEYISGSGSVIDYIHDDDAAQRMSEAKDNIAFFMPKMEKEDLFKTVITDGVFPKKSFSIGHARDKRYYLECRKITAE